MTAGGEALDPVERRAVILHEIGPDVRVVAAQAGAGIVEGVGHGCGAGGEHGPERAGVHQVDAVERHARQLGVEHEAVPGLPRRIERDLGPRRLGPGDGLGERDRRSGEVLRDAVAVRVVAEPRGEGRVDAEAAEPDRDVERRAAGERGAVDHIDEGLPEDQGSRRRAPCVLHSAVYPPSMTIDWAVR